MKFIEQSFNYYLPYPSKCNYKCKTDNIGSRSNKVVPLETPYYIIMNIQFPLAIKYTCQINNIRLHDIPSFNNCVIKIAFSPFPVKT